MTIVGSWEISEYGAREGSGWSCVVHKRKVVRYFEKKDSARSRYGKKHNNSF
jgi:hypothetical protein